MQRNYEEKLAMVADYLDSSCGVREIAGRHKISPSQVSRWAKQYLRRGPEALRPKSKKGVPVSRRNDKVRSDPTPPPEQVPDEGLREYCEQLKFENEALRAELGLFAKKPGPQRGRALQRGEIGAVRLAEAQVRAFQAAGPVRNAQEYLRVPPFEAARLRQERARQGDHIANIRGEQVPLDLNPVE